ncbi:MAG: hypothetical protein PVG65_03225 [Candidatus Thorarchaeota archaeon]
MSSNRGWILVLTLIVALFLAISGAFQYPLNTMGIVYILLYELIVVLGCISILFLIYKKGIE